MLDEIVIWVNARVIEFTQLWPDRSFFSFGFNVTALLAVLFVCLICGAMGALVVGNRMAFFSDALAHCAFLGVGVGLAVALLLRADLRVFHQRVFEIMIVFSVARGREGLPPPIMAGNCPQRQPGNGKCRLRSAPGGTGKRRCALPAPPGAERKRGY